MMWIIGMVIAAFFAGYLAKGIRIDEAYDEGYEDCIEDFVHGRLKLVTGKKDD